MDDSPKLVNKAKKGLISKTWARCKSYSSGIGTKRSSPGVFQLNAVKMNKSKSWPRGLVHSSTNISSTQVQNYYVEEKVLIRRKKPNRAVVPEGCFSIYVGPEKQRFVIKTVYVNHPQFRMLLEEAESEYGYSSDGPLVLPCDVSHFVKVLMGCEEMGSKGCRFIAKSPPPKFVVDFA